MVVKDQIGRKRYILCSTSGLPKRELFRFLNENNIKTKVVFHTNTHCILKCRHTSKDELLRLLETQPLKDKGIKSIKTSGTIRKLKNYLNDINTF